MNEKVESAPPKGLEEASASVGLPVAIEQAGLPAKSVRKSKRSALRLEDLRKADLKGKDLTKIKGTSCQSISPARTDAKLSEEIAKFPALCQVAAISSEARKIFIGLLAACVYSWLVIGTTTDLALILNPASSPLPIIKTPIPIASVYVIGAAPLAAVYCYLHFYLQRLWRTLATLPAVFPDGTPARRQTDPGLLTNLVRANFKALRTNPLPLTQLENLLTILLAWWLVPLTLIALWARYLPAHDLLGATWLVALIAVTAMFGRHSYWLAGTTLRGEMPAAEDRIDDDRGVSKRALHEFRQIHPGRLTVSLTAAVGSTPPSAFRDNPQADYTWLAKLLNTVGIQRSPTCAKRTSPCGPKAGPARSGTMSSGSICAVATSPSPMPSGAFLTNVDLRGANLREAILVEAQLRAPDPDDDDAQRGAQLQGADLKHAPSPRAPTSWGELRVPHLTTGPAPGR